MFQTSKKNENNWTCSFTSEETRNKCSPCVALQITLTVTSQVWKISLFSLFFHSLVPPFSDVVIPTNSADRSSIVLNAGQKVMVLKSPKGIYMQLENGKIIAIRTAYKVGAGGAANKGTEKKVFPAQPQTRQIPLNRPPFDRNVRGLEGRRGKFPNHLQHRSLFLSLLYFF